MLLTLDDIFPMDIWGIIFGYMAESPYSLNYEACYGSGWEMNIFLDACAEGNVQVVDFVYRQFDRIDIQGQGDDAFLIASTNRYIDIMKYLIERGTNIFVSRNFAYKHACSNGHLDVIKLLNQNGVNVLKKRYAMKVAFECDQQKVIRYLNKQGVPLDAIFEYSKEESDSDRESDGES